MRSSIPDYTASINNREKQDSRGRYAQSSVFCVVIVILSAVITNFDAVSGTNSLRKAGIGLAMVCAAVSLLVGPKHPRLEFWLTRVAAVLAVGSFVFWALE